MRTLLTGGAGFIGHHMVDYLLQTTDWDLVIMDRLDTSGNLNRLSEVLGEHAKRVSFVWHDLKAPLNEFVERDIGQIDHIIHLAASSHVDRSISDPLSFIMDNVVGTTNLLIWAKKAREEGKFTGKFINFSTDEVFGPAEPGHDHKESEPHLPSNPYSASKSGQGMIGYSFWVTYGFPIITTYTMNNYGERQHPEKLVPKAIRSVLNGTPMPIFAEVGEDGQLRGVGSRFWLHAWNTASAVKHIIEHGKVGESYNVVGFDEFTNLEICEKVAGIIGKPLIPEFVDFHKTRPGHDRRYALDGTKLRELGWVPEITFDEGMKRMVEFTLNNPKWA